MGPQVPGDAGPSGAELFVDRQIAIDHRLDGEMPGDEIAATGPLRQPSGDACSHVVDVAANPAVDTVADHFLDRATG